MEGFTIWHLIESGLLATIFTFVVKFTMQFTTHTNAIATLKEAVKKIPELEQAVNDGKVERAKLEGGIKALSVAHDGMSDWLKKIDQKLDLLIRDLREERRDAK